ncbi:hypothetical protein M885DRAFT_487958 [Pelagophyceae sp. CCMP2097]|nr:hypothetical protein M885DRAFT_487958 [Pelagophyceae sp. CCMP2097]
MANYAAALLIGNFASSRALWCPAAARARNTLRGRPDAAANDDETFCDPDAPTAGCVDALGFWELDGTAAPTAAAEDSAVEGDADGFCDVEAQGACVDFGDFWGASAADEDEASRYRRLLEADSHAGVEIDATTGSPRYREQFAWVDEAACIGCLLCEQVAPATFFIEPDQGMARVFRQHGDADEVIDEAILTCPVQCIKRVNFDALRRLELRRGQDGAIDVKRRAVARAEGRAPRTPLNPGDVVDPDDPDVVARERELDRKRRSELRAALPTEYTAITGGREVEL